MLVVILYYIVVYVNGALIKITQKRGGTRFLTNPLYRLRNESGPHPVNASLNMTGTLNKSSKPVKIIDAVTESGKGKKRLMG